jgi:hypothetical protein
MKQDSRHPDLCLNEASSIAGLPDSWEVPVRIRGMSPFRRHGRDAESGEKAHAFNRLSAVSKDE